MCNIAGYIGKEPAAPILIEMMRRQDGLNGGYYTGIATIGPDGRLHWAKVVGDVEALVRTTEALRLPGTVGIVHSRTNSGGDREWAHPFVGAKGTLAYIANGSTGLFANVARQSETASRLSDAGYPFLSRSPEPVAEYPRLPDGSSVHMSEVMCRLIEAHVDAGRDPATAMRLAYTQLPSEIVGLMIHTAIPRGIVATRINQPLVAARHREGWYLSSTALAFPAEGIEWTMPLAPLATAVFTPDRMELTPFELSPPVAPIPWNAGHERVLEILTNAADRPVTMQTLKAGTQDLWPPGALPQSFLMLYELLRALHDRGRLAFDTVRVPGVLAGATAPQTHIRLVG